MRVDSGAGREQSATSLPSREQCDGGVATPHAPFGLSATVFRGLRYERAAARTRPRPGSSAARDLDPEGAPRDDAGTVRPTADENRALPRAIPDDAEET